MLSPTQLFIFQLFRNGWMWICHGMRWGIAGVRDKTTKNKRIKININEQYTVQESTDSCVRWCCCVCVYFRFICAFFSRNKRKFFANHNNEAKKIAPGILTLDTIKPAARPDKHMQIRKYTLISLLYSDVEQQQKQRVRQIFKIVTVKREKKFSFREKQLTNCVRMFMRILKCLLIFMHCKILFGATAFDPIVFFRAVLPESKASASVFFEKKILILLDKILLTKAIVSTLEENGFVATREFETRI